jgi:zinc protease
MIRRITFVILLTAISGIQAAPSQKEHATAVLSGLNFPPVEFTPPPVKEEKLASGAVLLTVEDNSLPFLTVEIHFPGGTSLEPVDQAGTWDAAVSLLSIDGAGGRTGEQLAEDLSRLGARFSIHNEYESWVVRLTALKWNFPRAFAILEKVLLEPSLSDEKLAVVLDGMETDISQRNNKPESVAGRKLAETIYRGERRGKSLVKDDLKRITTETIRKELNRRLYAGNAITTCGGDCASAGVQSKLNALLARFPAREAPAAPPAARSPAPRSRILLVKMDVPQAAVVIGQELPRHDSPDFYALQLGNHILGGNSFNSRLMKEIRTVRGLAYYSMSYNSFFANDGRFVAAAGTRTEAAHETVELMMQLIKGMQKPAAEEELTLARDSILNSLVFMYDDPESYLQNQVRFRLHNLPADYLANYPGRIRALTAQEIADAFKKNLDTSPWIVVAGPESLKPVLEKILPVVVIDPEGTIPGQ